MREEDLPIDIYYNKLLGKATIFVSHFCTNLTSKIMRKFSLSCSKVTTKHQNSISEFDLQQFSALFLGVFIAVFEHLFVFQG